MAGYILYGVMIYAGIELACWVIKDAPHRKGWFED